MNSKKRKAPDEHRLGARSLVSISIDSVLEHATDEEISSLQLTHCLHEMVVKSRKRQRKTKENFNRAVEFIPCIDLRDQMQSQEMLDESRQDVTAGEAQYSDLKVLRGGWNFFFSEDPEVAKDLSVQVHHWSNQLANMNCPLWSEERGKLVPGVEDEVIDMNHVTVENLSVISTNLLLYRAQVAFGHIKRSSRCMVKSDVAAIVEKNAKSIVIFPNDEYDLTICYADASHLNDTVDLLNYIVGPLVMKDYEYHPSLTGRLDWSPDPTHAPEHFRHSPETKTMKAKIAKMDQVFVKNRPRLLETPEYPSWEPPEIPGLS